MWSARTLDIDILLYGEIVVCTGDLHLPHPRMEYRRFVLEPASEIAPWMKHPTSQWTLARLLGHLEQGPACVCVAAVERSTQNWMLEALGAHFLGPRENQALYESDSRAGRLAAAWTPCGLQLLPWDRCQNTAKHRLERESPAQLRPNLRPRLMIALIPSLSVASDFDSLRVELGLPATGPIAWIEADDRKVAWATALAAVQAAWPARN